LLAFQSGRHAQ